MEPRHVMVAACPRRRSRESPSPNPTTTASPTTTGGGRNGEGVRGMVPTAGRPSSRSTSEDLPVERRRRPRRSPSTAVANRAALAYRARSAERCHRAASTATRWLSANVGNAGVHHPSAIVGGPTRTPAAGSYRHASPRRRRRGRRGGRCRRRSPQPTPRRRRRPSASRRLSRTPPASPVQPLRRSRRRRRSRCRRSSRRTRGRRRPSPRSG